MTVQLNIVQLCYKAYHFLTVIVLGLKYYRPTVHVYIYIYVLYIQVYIFTIIYVLSVEQQQHFKVWEEYDDSEDSFCEADGQFNLRNILVQYDMHIAWKKPFAPQKLIITRALW